MNATEYLTSLETTRRARLRSLVETFSSKEEAAIEIGIPRTFISKLLIGDRPFTEKTARIIEDNFGLEFGSLDREVMA